MIAWISRPLAMLAGIGWSLSIVLSIAALGGVLAPSWAQEALSFALFPLIPAAIILVYWAANGRFLHARTMWEFVFERAPAWLRYAHAGAWVYCFGLVAAQFFGLVRAGDGVGGAFIGMFYAATFTTLWTLSQSTRCAKGHVVGPFEQFCHACGAPIPENR